MFIYGAGYAWFYLGCLLACRYGRKDFVEFAAFYDVDDVHLKKIGRQDDAEEGDVWCLGFVFV